MTEKLYKKSLCWVRRDLRLRDHHSLFEATRLSQMVYVAFVFDMNILNKLNSKSDKRVQFIFESLKELDAHLDQLNSHLIWLHGDPIHKIPHVVQSHQIEAVFTNEDYEPYAKKRDKAVSKRLKELNVDFHQFKDQVIFSGNEVLKPTGEPYKVFTAYKKKWIQRFRPEYAKEFKPNNEPLRNVQPEKAFKEKIDLKSLGFLPSDIEITPGEISARKQLRSFIQKSLSKYDQERDFPTHNGTSQLSIHLRFGTISIRECLRASLSTKVPGSETWMSELIWREFFFMILDRFPHVVNQAFKKDYNQIKWPGKREHFKAWCQGQTGYPIVDAAMRQLNATGLMHNRLRMITASFLVKDLLIDWRKGESYFAEKLLDYDLAANNGNWQWCASTGCDAQPYFRIFNPANQAKKFDPQNEYIKKWAPEYLSPSGSFPKPIVDHAIQRRKALQLYKK